MSEVEENYGINVRRCKHFASLFLGDTNLIFLAYGNFEGMSDGEKLKVDRLNHAFEVTVREIAYEYGCFRKTDTIEIENEKIHFYVLSEQLLEALELTKNGKQVPFKVKENYLYAPNGKYEFTYAYMPKNLNELTRIPYSSGRLTERIIALGTCAQYCLMAGRYNDAVAFDNQYKDALNAMKKSFIKRKVKQRRWL